MSDDTDRLIDEIMLAVGAHDKFIPVEVDNEAMCMLYEKVGMPVPVYPPGWVDFWTDSIAKLFDGK